MCIYVDSHALDMCIYLDSGVFIKNAHAAATPLIMFGIPRTRNLKVDF